MFYMEQSRSSSESDESLEHTYNKNLYKNSKDVGMV